MLRFLIPYTESLPFPHSIASPYIIQLYKNTPPPIDIWETLKQTYIENVGLKMLNGNVENNYQRGKNEM